MLQGMKTEDGQIGQGADLAAPVFAPHGVAGVGHQGQLVTIGKIPQLVIIAGLIGVIDGDNRLGAGGQPVGAQHLHHGGNIVLIHHLAAIWDKITQFNPFFKS